MKIKILIISIFIIGSGILANSFGMDNQENDISATDGDEYYGNKIIKRMITYLVEDDNQENGEVFLQDNNNIVKEEFSEFTQNAIEQDGKSNSQITTIARNQLKNMEWLVELANRGNSEAQYQLGLRYENWDIPENDNNQLAIKLFIMAAKQHHEDALSELKNLANKSIFACLSLLNFYDKNNDSTSILRWGIKALELQNDHKKTIAIFKKREKTDPYFKLLLANLYEEGRYVSKNEKKAFKRYCQLSNILQEVRSKLFPWFLGRRIPNDFPDAIAWYHHNTSMHFHTKSVLSVSNLDKANIDWHANAMLNGYIQAAEVSAIDKASFTDPILNFEQNLPKLFIHIDLGMGNYDFKE